MKKKILREFSSGGVVFRKFRNPGSKFEIRFLIAASMPSELYPETVWRLPKGWLDDENPGIPGPMASGKEKADENILRSTALREVREEGGVEAEVIEKIGTEKYFYKHPTHGQILKFVTFYLMEWVRDLPEGFDSETSAVKWLSFEDALKTLTFSGEKEVLKKAKEILAPVA